MNADNSLLEPAVGHNEVPLVTWGVTPRVLNLVSYRLPRLIEMDTRNNHSVGHLRFRYLQALGFGEAQSNIERILLFIYKEGSLSFN